jgi:hypothetical protein
MVIEVNPAELHRLEFRRRIVGMKIKQHSEEMIRIQMDLTILRNELNTLNQGIYHLARKVGM